MRWLRWRRALTWALRGLVVGLALALLFGAGGMGQARLLRAEFLALTGILALAVSSLAGLVAFAWPLRPLEAARYCDRVFHLEERVSTALEFRDAPASDLSRRQAEDAWQAAQKVKPARDLPLRLSRFESLLALTLALVLGLTAWRGETWFQAAQRARAVQAAVQEQEQVIAEMLTKIESDPNLSQAQKRALSEPLEEALNALEDNPTLEGSVSTLTAAGEKLQALSDPQAQALAQALGQAGRQLASQEGSPLQDVGQQLAQGEAVAAAAQLSQLDMSDLSQTEAEALASQLEALAQSLASIDPQLAAQLNQAAQALRQGDLRAAQQALQQAAQSLADAGQQMAFSQAAGQSARQLQQGAGRVLAAGGGGQRNQGASNAQGGAGNSQGGAAAGGAGAGQGEGEANSSQLGDEAGSSPIPQNNGPGDGGERAYEPIYAPSLLGGEAGPLVGLPESGEEGEVIGVGPTAPGQESQSLVPYSEVYAQYEEVNRRALENGQVPLQFMQIIRNYFDALKP
ncbi:MAG: hypothetical protein Fur0043_18870 [Anaerolineales bacterium]